MSEPLSGIPFEDRCFTVPEVCRDHLRVSRATLYKLVKEGRLTLTKFGSRTVITGRAIRKCRGEAA